MTNSTRSPILSTLALASLTALGCAPPGSSEGADSAADSSGYIAGLTAIDHENSSNAKILVDGKAGASVPQWSSSNIYSASDYPMEAIIDLGALYDVTDIELFHGEGGGFVDVAALSPGGSQTVEADYTTLEQHDASIYDGWEIVKQPTSVRTRYLRLEITSYATFYTASEIRCKGTLAASSTPDMATTPPPGNVAPVAGLSQVAPGEYQSHFLVDGNVYALGDWEATGAATPSKGVPQPIAVPSDVKFVDMVAGLHQGYAIDTQGRVWGWGSNGSGEAGTGATGDYNFTPVMIETDATGAPFTGVIGGASHFAQNFAVKSDGTLWFWGQCGTSGYCGIPGATGNFLRPTQVPLPAGVKLKSLSASWMMMGLATDGSVYAWGNSGAYGEEFDLSTGEDGMTPAKVQGLPANIVEIASSGGQSGGFNYALTSDGNLWGWGARGTFMGFADGRSIHPTLLNAELGFSQAIKDVGANDETTHVVLADGSLWGWGANGQGEVGNLPGPDYAQTVGNDTGWGGVEVMQIAPVRIVPSVSNFEKVWATASDCFYIFAQTVDGKLYFMGRNKSGIAGDGIYPGAASGNYYAASDVAATYPNSWDVSLAKQVSPMTVKVGIPTLSPYCIAHPGTTPCDNM